MNYSIREKQNPLDRTESQFYAVPVWNGKIELRDLAQEIAELCTLTEADVTAVLESFLSRIPPHLIRGSVICLGDFGSFRLSFRSKGSRTPEEVSSEDIHNVRIVFRARPELKHRVSRVKFTKKS